MNGYNHILTNKKLFREKQKIKQNTEISKYSSQIHLNQHLTSTYITYKNQERAQPSPDLFLSITYAAISTSVSTSSLLLCLAFTKNMTVKITVKTNPII